jgi:hypothetical protein
VPEYQVLQVTQLRTGFDAELGDQGPTQVGVRGQRVGLPAGPVQRKHPLFVQVLAKRVSGDDSGRLHEHAIVSAGSKIGVQADLNRAQPEFLEPGDERGQEGQHGDVGQRRAAPKGEGGIHGSPGL